MGKGLTAAVVGGGGGGLAAAAALTRAGIEASVYEQAPELGEVGAGVLIGPNSVRLLHRLGLAEAINEVGGWVGEGSTYYRHDGTRVAPVMTTDSSGWAAMYGMHRADLVEVLCRAVPGSRIHPGQRAVSGFDQDPVSDQGTGKARVTFENGAVAEADMVIAADGIHSAMRRFVAQGPGRAGLLRPDLLPRAARHIARAMVASADLPGVDGRGQARHRVPGRGQDAELRLLPPRDGRCASPGPRPATRTRSAPPSRASRPR